MNPSLTIDSGCLQYSVRHQVIKTRNADEVLERIHTDIESGNPVNELELIFAPLMESRLPIKDLLFETINSRFGQNFSNIKLLLSSDRKDLQAFSCGLRFLVATLIIRL